MTRRARALAAAVLLASSACQFGITQTAPPAERREPVPDKYKGDAPPELIDAGIEGCERATLDANLYYCAVDEHWYRWALNRWYMAFTWDGNWFPTRKAEVPASLRALTPAPEEVKKTREDRLRELEEQLEKLDPEQAPQSSD